MTTRDLQRADSHQSTDKLWRKYVHWTHFEPAGHQSQIGHHQEFRHLFLSPTTEKSTMHNRPKVQETVEEIGLIKKIRWQNVSGGKTR